MAPWKMWRREHEQIVSELRERERQIMEMTRRLIRLEAQTEIYRPREGDQ